MPTTTAQFNANRRNAQAATGPRTEAGKAASSQNACKLHLFSTRNFDLPHEEAEYSELTTALWDRLNPQDALEGAYAIEILRATWRLRRCANVEADLVDKAFAISDKKQEDPADATLYSSLNEIQTSVDRARTQALGILNRATAELRRLQTERRLRVETLPEQFEPTYLGISDTREITKGITATVNAQFDLAKIDQIKQNNAVHLAALAAFPPLDIAKLMKRHDPPAKPAPAQAEPETKPTQTPEKATAAAAELHFTAAA